MAAIRKPLEPGEKLNANARWHRVLERVIHDEEHVVALEAFTVKQVLLRIVLEQYPEGVYVLVFERNKEGVDVLTRDNLQDNIGIAKQAALELYGITEDMWRQCEDTNFNGVH